jgi:hypothetical protein
MCQLSYLLGTLYLIQTAVITSTAPEPFIQRYLPYYFRVSPKTNSCDLNGRAASGVEGLDSSPEFL